MTRTRQSAARRCVFAVAALLLAVVPLRIAGQQSGQQTQPPAAPSSWPDDVLKQEAYVMPPKELADAVLTPRYLNVTLTNLSPDKKWFLDEVGDGPVLMKTFSKPFHELGGLFVDFKANRVRTLTIRNNVGIQIISASDGTKRQIQLPAGARVSNAVWSPDSAAVAFLIDSDDATHLWIADVATGKSRQLTRTPLLATLVSTFEFTTDSKSIAAVLIPDGRAPMPQPPASPSGPTVKIADSDKNRLRTFPSLMSTTYEKELLEWHSTGQLALIDVAKGTVKKIGQQTMIRAVDVSPDAKFARVTRMVKPFSYDVPVSNFGSIEEVWDMADGKLVAKVMDRPINLGVGDDSQPPTDPPAADGGRGNQNQTGKRELAWRADSQGLTFLEQEPPPKGESAGARSGRGTRAPQRKDRLYQWLPPFNDASKKVIFESDTRMTGVRYSPDMKLIFFSERNGQNTSEFAVALAEPAQRYTLARYNSEDASANPGTLVGVRGVGAGGGRGTGAGGGRGGAGAAAAGPVQLSADGTSVFLQGAVYDKNPNDVGPKTFIDKVAIKTGEKQRIYESENTGIYERVSSILNIDAGKFVVARESATEIGQQYLLEGGKRIQLTKNQDYTPDLSSAPVERLVVERADGFKFRTIVTLPPNYQKGTRLPAIFWFYPREFEDQESYDRPDRTFNKNAFPSFGTRSMQFFIRLGYAVVEPDSPIIGPAGQMNNNYVHDLRNNLAAVIDELDRRGLIDRTRLAIGGHSYGAFSTVNAMVHTPFFKAGIAGDGAYNRTLTPIGFQTERRDLWEAPNVYLGMSPFLYANNLTGALLMYHNLADQNVGTDPTNSLRLYHALNGLGKTTALYLYPYEDHGPVARETLLDMWARWAAWLDKYVKHPTKVEPKKPVTTEQGSR